MDFTAKPISSMCATIRIRGVLLPSGAVPKSRIKLPASSVSGLVHFGSSVLTSSRIGPSLLLTAYFSTSGLRIAIALGGFPGTPIA
jgi:hypothetical protein